MELLIWAGGRWRRVCASSGRVAGWRRRARFVCGRRGALREIPLAAALRSIVKGPRLPKERQEVKPKAPAFAVPYNRHGQNVTQFPAIRKDACIQTDTESIQTDIHKPIQTLPQTLTSQNDKENQVARSQEKENQVPRSRERDNQVSRTPQKRLRSASTEIIEARPFKQQKVDRTQAKSKQGNEFSRKLEKQKLKPLKNDIQKLVEYKSGSVTSTDEEQKEKTAKTMKKLSKDKEMEQLLTKDSATESEDQFKELIINEEDVLLLRRYIETHNTNIDLLKYDEDDTYKTMIFFKINPLVRLERCPQIARMLKNRDANITVHFARQLGLCHRTESDDTVKSKPKRTKYRYAKAIAMSRSTVDSEDLPLKKNDKAVISLSDDSDSAYERIKRKNQKYFNDKPSNTSRRIIESDDGTDTGFSRSESFSDSEIMEGIINRKKTRNRPAKEMAKHQISETNDGTRRHEDKNDKQDRKFFENDSYDKNRSKTRNKDNVTKKLTKQSTISTDRSGKMRFIVFNSQESQKGAKNHKINDDQGNKKSKNNKDKNQETENPRLKDLLKPANKRCYAVPRRSSVPPGREYSMLEDQAIVAWISTSTQRERAVNGNRIWRELQDTYQNLTGQKRSWHSLRNRYLRYILPSLGSLALPTSQAQRLRAHASLGELKSRKKPRRNSVFDLPVVRSASARIRPRPPPESTDNHSQARPGPEPSPIENRPSTSKGNYGHARAAKKTESQTTKSSTETQKISTSPRKKSSPHEKRLLRSSIHLTRTPSENLRIRSPNKHNNKKTSFRKSPTKSAIARSPSKSSSSRTKVSTSPTYSELTRRLLRNRSTPQHSPQPPQPAPAATNHKRRLFNPLRPTSSGSPATSQ
ncbi:rap1 myb domain-containing protein [Phthorimaea operculella]|nr:rap1 myb domain-containing protein [Phthorimaea operculella]